jgi:hypothetical protein
LFFWAKSVFFLPLAARDFGSPSSTPSRNSSSHFATGCFDHILGTMTRKVLFATAVCGWQCIVLLEKALECPKNHVKPLACRASGPDLTTTFKQTPNGAVVEQKKAQPVKYHGWISCRNRRLLITFRRRKYGLVACKLLGFDQMHFYDLGTCRSMDCFPLAIVLKTSIN